MINSVEIGKNYAIRLLEFYGGTKQNVNVIGITNIDNVSLNQDDYNIYQTYFAPIGLGMTSFYTAIHEDTKIYICKVISSLEPYELEDDKIFIPESLIDMNTSDELIKSLTFTFSISPVIRRFQSEEETGEFTREIEEKIKKRLHGIIEFSLLDSEVSSAYDEVYLENTDITLIEENRRKEYELFLQQRDKMLSTDKIKESAFTTSLTEMNYSKERYDKALKELELEKQRYNGLCVSLQNKLDKLNND